MEYIPSLWFGCIWRFAFWQKMHTQVFYWKTFVIFCCFTAMENFVINGRSIYVHFTEYSGEQNDKTYDDEILGRAWWSTVHQA